MYLHGGGVAFRAICQREATSLSWRTRRKKIKKRKENEKHEKVWRSGVETPSLKYLGDGEGGDDWGGDHCNFIGTYPHPDSDGDNLGVVVDR